MDVLYLNHSSAPNRLFDLLRRNLADDVRYTFAAFDDGGPAADAARAEGVDVALLAPISMPLLPRAAAEVRALVRRGRFDLVHGNLFLPGVALTLAGLPGGMPPTVFTRHHDRSHYLLGRRLHVALDGWTARRAGVTIAPSPAVARTLAEERVPTPKVQVVPHGIEWDRLQPDPTAIERWRARLGPGPAAVAAIRLDPIKGVPDLFAAFARAHRVRPDLQLFVAGLGAAGAAAATEEAAAAAGIGDAVTLLGWVDDLPALLAASDVYVQASRAESFGLAILEAAGLGVPIAVTTPGGTVDIVQGVQDPIAPGDVDALGDRILAVLDGPGARHLAEAAAPAVRDRFSAQAMAAGHLEVYRRVAGGPAGLS